MIALPRARDILLGGGPVYDLMEGTSAEVVALILARFFPDARTVLDATYGAGGFWEAGITPPGLVVTGLAADPDRVPPGGAVGDFTAMEAPDGAYDVAIYDPPHVPDAGAGSVMGRRYATYKGPAFEPTVRAGLRECARVARLGVLCKVKDQTHSGRPLVMTRWCMEELGDAKPIRVLNGGKLRDGRWVRQRSPWSLGASYLYWRVPSRAAVGEMVAGTNRGADRGSLC